MVREIRWGLPVEVMEQHKGTSWRDGKFYMLIGMLVTQVYSFVKIYTTVLLRPAHSFVCNFCFSLKMHTYIKLFYHPVLPTPYPTPT